MQLKVCDEDVASLARESTPGASAAGERGVNGSASPPGRRDGDFHAGADGKELLPRRDGGPGDRNRLFV